MDRRVQVILDTQVSLEYSYSPGLRRHKAQPTDDYHCPVYEEAYRRSMEDPQEFWAEVASGISWMRKWDRVLDDANPPFTKWFPGGMLNVCFNALDRHADSEIGDNPALIYDSPITGQADKFTFKELLFQVERCAGMLSNLGVCKGDRVIIYMPMIPEAMITMLACARIGAIHSLVFGGFSSQELAKRVEHSKARVIVAASHGIEPNKTIWYKQIVDEAIELSTHKPKHAVIYQRPKMEKVEMKLGFDVDWENAMDCATPHGCVPVHAEDPLYLLYTSGTTGEPKGVIRPSGGHAVVLPWTMKYIYGMNKGDVWWAASDLGWVLGHSYICYGPLLNGSTTILYEGKPVSTPDAYQFFRVIHEYNANALFTAPTALRSIKREDPHGEHGTKKYPLQSFRYLFVAGEHCDYETREWAEKAFKVPVLDNWWQTETGHAITATSVGLGCSTSPPRDVSGMPVPGYDVRVLRPDRSEAEPGELGRIVCKMPLPPGNFTNLYSAGERFVKTYFSEYPGYYDTHDAGFKDQHGYICVMSRDDDVINVAGHRLSTSQLEEAILEHPDVSDCAVVGVPDPMKGEVPLGLYITAKGEKLYSAFSVVLLPGSIEDPSVFMGIKVALQAVGFALEAPDPQ
ncbi:unnamed protein product [Darwinula stevensoni]|uniref:Acyl-CoA synthetase short-chain family member 3, mitochondrial n=1 Tax=Darwinula stevensoni TaxID=69355 RepID=A0A7R9FSB3_9CRUS|nr:unnamed protein product [Darwinula stevensoni]CAG0902921.1 unnamed protein product [Darwinula stevensoni]